MHEKYIPLDGNGINVPTTVCHGLIDEFLPFGLERQTSESLGSYSELEILMAGHGLFVEKARELNRVLAGVQVPDCRLIGCVICGWLRF
ncbi:MAG: alpha/beta fold hydrolase [Halobacteriota archaeon]